MKIIHDTHAAFISSDFSAALISLPHLHLEWHLRLFQAATLVSSMRPWVKLNRLFILPLSPVIKCHFASAVSTSAWASNEAAFIFFSISTFIFSSLWTLFTASNISSSSSADSFQQPSAHTTFHVSPHYCSTKDWTTLNSELSHRSHRAQFTTSALTISWHFSRLIHCTPLVARLISSRTSTDYGLNYNWHFICLYLVIIESDLNWNNLSETLPY